MLRYLTKNQFESQRLASLREPFEVFHCAILVVDLGVVADVIAKVFHRTAKDWREPHCGHADLFEISELLGYSVQVANTVANRISLSFQDARKSSILCYEPIGIFERAWIDLIEVRTLPPILGGPTGRRQDGQ